MAEGLVLIDTSIWIWALRPSGVAAIRHRLDEVLAEGKGATTPLILLELLSGTREERDYTELSEDLSALYQFPISDSVWTRSYRLSFDLRRQGLTVPATDTLIVSVAQENQLTLLHADRHFDLIAEKTDLKVES